MSFIEFLLTLILGFIAYSWGWNTGYDEGWRKSYLNYKGRI